MPWTETTRSQYQRDGLRFASDMTDAEWALIARRLPPRRRLGRPRTTDLRRIIEAILYVLATGCQWRALPGDFPPRSTVQGYFYTWRDTGLWQRIVTALVRRARRDLGRRPTRRRPSSTARARQPPRLAGRAASTPVNASMGANAISSPIPTAFCSPCTFTQPMCRMCMAPSRC